MSNLNVPHDQDELYQPVTQEHNIEFYLNLTEELSLTVHWLRTQIQELNSEIKLANRRVSFYKKIPADLCFKDDADLQLMVCRSHNKRLLHENKALCSCLNSLEQNRSILPVPLFPNSPPLKNVAVVKAHTKTK